MGEFQEGTIERQSARGSWTTGYPSHKDKKAAKQHII
jgi:hypothetical protein